MSRAMSGSMLWKCSVSMNRTWLPILLLLTAIIVSAVPVYAQTSTVTIDGNGNIIPSTVAIQKAGNIYTLTADLGDTSIVVLANDIVIDGANHALAGLGSKQNKIALNLTATNVTVQNLHIINWKAGILGAWNNNTITRCTLSGNSQAIAIYGNDYIIRGNAIMGSDRALLIDGGAIRPKGDSNLISENCISANIEALDVLNSNGTTITANTIAGNTYILTLATNTQNTILFLNNFTGNTQVLHIPFGGPFIEGVPTFSPAGQWDNGSVGNYWSDYKTLYPNATEVGHSGIGNTAYTITEKVPYSSTHANGISKSGIATLGTAVDNHPFIDPIVVSTGFSDAQPNPSPTVPEFQYWILLVTVLLAVYSVILVALRYPKLFAKRKSKKS
jgi:hypothetical protein